ncbi:UNKNOWN [Stylonychia lemnae]|uniref:Uncharacterized protein n=1 Tax=Stylonychia lemnae TaxID=5949 RepID=A0A078A6U2_STYLE|nr:UNKNOWN [Stylonychia lemnae]|eukprot:CDW77970.1 UNKNOWN [Stylonychia lemnae]
MQSFTNELEASEKKQKDALLIKTSWQNKLFKHDITNKMVQKIITIESQHPFLQGSKLLENKLPKSYRIDYEKYLKLKTRGLSVQNGYRNIQTSKEFKRGCCQNKQQKLNDFLIEKDWDYREKFREIDSSLEERNELINTTQVERFIKDCFNRINEPPPRDPMMRPSDLFRMKKKSIQLGIRTPSARNRDKKELFEAIQKVRYGELFSASQKQPKIISEKLAKLKDAEKTLVIEDMIDYLDQDLTQFKKKLRTETRTQFQTHTPLRKQLNLPVINYEQSASPSQSYLSPRIQKQIQYSESLKYKRYRQASVSSKFRRL